MPIKNLDKPQGPTAQWLLGVIEEYLEYNDMENDGRTFGWLVSKDRTMVQRLRDGGDIGLTKMDDILAFMQRPQSVYRAKTSEGLVVWKPLKPLNIKPRSLPHD